MGGFCGCGGDFGCGVRDGREKGGEGDSIRVDIFIWVCF